MTHGLVKTNDPAFVRDPETGALQVADPRSFEHYKAMREQVLKKKRESEETEELKNKVARLESLVEELLASRDG